MKLTRCGTVQTLVFLAEHKALLGAENQEEKNCGCGQTQIHYHCRRERERERERQRMRDDTTQCHVSIIVTTSFIFPSPKKYAKHNIHVHVL